MSLRVILAGFGWWGSICCVFVTWGSMSSLRAPELDTPAMASPVFRISNRRSTDTA